MTAVRFWREVRFRNAAWVEFGAAMYIAEIGETLYSLEK